MIKAGQVAVNLQGRLLPSWYACLSESCLLPPGFEITSAHTSGKTQPSLYSYVLLIAPVLIDLSPCYVQRHIGHRNARLVRTRLYQTLCTVYTLCSVSTVSQYADILCMDTLVPYADQANIALEINAILCTTTISTCETIR